MKTKKCFRCEKKKPIDSFYKHPQMGDGHLGKCKKCNKKDVTDRYYSPEGREKVREYERKRFQDPERKKKILIYAKKRRLRFPGKTIARRVIAEGIRNGKIKKNPCEKCGEIRSQAHHNDYRKPLEIIWLCFKHHREEHGQKVG